MGENSDIIQERQERCSYCSYVESADGWCNLNCAYCWEIDDCDEYYTYIGVIDWENYDG